MSKEYCRARIQQNTTKPFKITMAVLIIAWFAVFVPVLPDEKSGGFSMYSICLLELMRFEEKSIPHEYYHPELLAGFWIGIIVLPVIILLIALCYLIMVKMPKKCSLALTENGISGVKKTLLSTKTIELPFENITSISVRAGVIDKLVGGKTLAIASARGLIKFIGVVNAEEFAEQYKSLIGNQSAVASAPSGDDADKLVKLKALLDSGVLTQEEYEAKKAEILSRM
ncbi:MAG: SHOCT domain-containing protein [Oscillospiraceae bacterium]|nr:SHOCT domain-containing protein [Oscillospiraceae bacterium]